MGRHRRTQIPYNGENRMLVSYKLYVCLVVQTQAFRDLLPHEPWQPHEVFAKGKGTLTTYFLDCEAPSDAAGGQGLV